MSYANDDLERQVRRMLDPENRQRKSVVDLVRDCLASRTAAWKKAQELDAEVRRLRDAYEPVMQTNAEDGLALDEYWTRRT